MDTPLTQLLSTGQAERSKFGVSDGGFAALLLTTLCSLVAVGVAAFFLYRRSYQMLTNATEEPKGETEFRAVPPTDTSVT